MDQGSNKKKSGCVHIRNLCCHCWSNKRNKRKSCFLSVAWFVFTLLIREETKQIVVMVMLRGCVA